MEHSYISHDHELTLDDENVLASECLETEQLDKSSSTSCDSLVDIDADPSPNKVAVLAKHKALLLTRSEEKFTMLWFCSSDDDIKYYAGFQSYSAMCFFLLSSTRILISFTMWAQEILLMANQGNYYKKRTTHGRILPYHGVSPQRSSREVYCRSIQYVRGTCIKNFQYMDSVFV